MMSLCQITTNKFGLLRHFKRVGIALVLTIIMSNPIVYAQGTIPGPPVTSCPDAPGMFVSGSTGADGALDFSGAAPGTTILFNPATFDPPLDQDGDNVYHFTTVSIPVDVTVRLSAELLGAIPVVWLVSGTARIDGVLDLNGEDGHSHSTDVPVPAVAGAGGWGGGRRAQPGNGPGGGQAGGCDGGGAGHVGAGGDGSLGGVAYGNEFLLPLLGGSGGAGGGNPNGSGGGAGGGALLIASSESVIVNGSISANGGDWGSTPLLTCGDGGGGSGGAIRLMAHTICGGGSLSANGGGGGFGSANAGSRGRIRLEAFGHTFGGNISPPPSVVTPGIVFLPANAPSVRIVRVAGVDIPANPTGSFIMPDVTLDNVSAVTVEIEASNIPPGTVVELTITPETGSQQIVDSTPLDGTLELSTATAMVTLPHGFSRFFVQTNWTP